MPNTEKCIYLTFDDGPIPEVTPFVLDLLNQHQIKATFFCIGDNVRKHPKEFQRVIDEGHSVGNHTYNHLNGWKTKVGPYIENTKNCEVLFKTKLFRPPYGRIRREQISILEKNYKIIMWDVLSGDFDEDIGWEKCYQNVVKHTHAGSIVVFHDSLRAFPRLKESLPRAIEHWLKAGFSFKKLEADLI